jgi:hypothetical protein
MESIDKRLSEGISHAETERGSTMLKKLETHSDADRLAQLGYQAELKRTFSLPSLIALCLCLMATWEATCAVVAQALAGGGAPCLFYNLCVDRLYVS